MPTAVITGANNGIGYAFAKLLLKEGYKTYATSRLIGPNLKELGENGAKISVLDVASTESIANFKKTIGDEPVDILINNAAIYVGDAKDRLTTLTPEGLSNTFKVNVFGPFLLTQALLPNILLSKEPHARIGHIASRSGSIGENDTGGLYSYRSSKSALNMLGKSMAIDLKKDGVVVAMLHPGMVVTHGTGDIRGQPNVVEPEYAVEKMWDILIKTSLDDTGKFWHREGFELDW